VPPLSASSTVVLSTSTRRRGVEAVRFRAKGYISVRDALLERRSRQVLAFYHSSPDP
jgi:hypothetical protein